MKKFKLPKIKGPKMPKFKKSPFKKYRTLKVKY